jgi:DNA-binding LytR/AlgR family response regulator
MTARGLRVLAVDDERPALDELAYLLREQPNVDVVLTASDAASALRILEDDAVDAVFLDIRMPRLTGLDLAKILARFAEPPQLVFVTAYDEHAVAAFDLKALDYVMKPVRVERLAEAVRRVDDAVHGRRRAADAPAATNDETIAVELGGTVRFIQRSDVRYVEASGDYARLHTATGSHLVRTPLATLEEQWEPAGFVRVHRSFLVSLAHIDELHLDGGHYAVRITGKDRQLLPVSRRHGRELRDRLVRGARQAPP